MKRIITFALVLFVCGCAATKEIVEKPEQKVQIANPASVNCEEQGGVLEIKNSNDGQYGLCKFDDGSVCEEWSLFRGECQAGERKVDLTNCESFFDGCNNCFVTDGRIGGCTRQFCQPEMMKEPKCLKFKETTQK